MPGTEPIPLSDVAKRLESSRRQIRDVGERIQPAEVTEIVKEVDATQKTFAEEEKSASGAINKSSRPEDLFDLEIAWKNRAAALAKWQQVISRWSSELYKDFTLVDQEEQIWELTLKASPAGSLPREVERAVRDLLAEIKRVKAEARKRLDAALVLENQLSQRATAISEVLDAVTLAGERFRESLIVAERVPLWEVMTEWRRVAPPTAAMAAALSRQVLDALEFFRTHAFGLSLVVFSFFAILIVASWLSRKVAQWTQNHPHFEEATHFLQRPLSLALLIILVFSLVFFTDRTPRLIQSLEALLLLIPVLRLLPRLVHPAARPVLFVVAVFYIFDSVRNVLLTIPLVVVDRLVFFAMDIVAIVVLIWL